MDSQGETKMAALGSGRNSFMISEIRETAKPPPQESPAISIMRKSRA
jgi:hypothetical protein